MSKYIVTKDDLKGQIECFPIELVQAMVDEQVKQGNPADPTVFQKFTQSGKDKGGFDWDKTKYSPFFWAEVIACENFERFFEGYKFSKNDSNVEEKPFYYKKYCCEDDPKQILEAMIELGGVNSNGFEGNVESGFFYMSPRTNEIHFIADTTTSEREELRQFVIKYGTELEIKPKEVTTEDLLNTIELLKNRIEELNQKLNNGLENRK